MLKTQFPFYAVNKTVLEFRLLACTSFARKCEIENDTDERRVGVKKLVRVRPVL